MKDCRQSGGATNSGGGDLPSMKPDKEANILRETEPRLGGIQLTTLLVSQTREGERVQRKGEGEAHWVIFKDT